MNATRRRALKATSAAALAALAGCLSEDDGGDDGSMLDREPDYKGWFEGVGNYEGTRDVRDQSEVTVTVGAQGSLGYYKFAPPAIAVSPGTTVRWEWTGKGGPHNVVTEEGMLDSGRPVDRNDATFEHTFESPGVFRYYCDPHRGQGMKGAVFVALDESE